MTPCPPKKEWPATDSATVNVTAGTLSSASNITVAGTVIQSPQAWIKRTSSQRLTLGATIVSTALVGFLWFWPTPPKIPLDLELSTTFIRFRLATEQRIVGLLPVKTIIASDLDRVELPAATNAFDGTIERDSSSRRLRIQLEGLEREGSQGTFTLQQTLLPAGTEVEMKVENGVYRLSLAQLETALAFSVKGAYRYRSTSSPRSPPTWNEHYAKGPEPLTLHPRNGRLDLHLGLQPGQGEEIAPTLRVDLLRFYEIYTGRDGGRTVIEENSRIRGGLLDLAPPGNPLTLRQGTELRLIEPLGTISSLQWRDGQIHFLFQGSSSYLSWGDQGHEINLEPMATKIREATLRATTLLAISCGSLSLILYGALFAKQKQSRLSRKTISDNGQRKEELRA